MSDRACRAPEWLTADTVVGLRTGWEPSKVLYDRPVSELRSEAAAEMTGRFKAVDLVDWFAVRYPKVKPRTVRAHIIGFTANDPSRKHMPFLSKRQPLFFKTSRGWLELLDPDAPYQDSSFAIRG